MLERKPWVVLAATILALASASAPAFDIWDTPIGSDNGFTTENVLWHGAPPQVHDLEPAGGAADQDWFLINPRAWRSYEVLFTNIGPNAEIAFTLPKRIANDAVTVLQTAINPDASGRLLALRWIQASSSTDFIRVNGFFTTYNGSSSYTVSMRETTLYCERYNTNGQNGGLIMQRTQPDRNDACDYQVWFHDQAGANTGTASGELSSVNAMAVIGVSSVAGVAGTAGSAFIAHTCGMGGIKAKLVQLEPATGFSFDTQCQPRPVG